MKRTGRRWGSARELLEPSCAGPPVAVCRSVTWSTTQPEKPTENHLTYLDKFLQSRRGTEEYVRPSFLLSPLLRVKTPRVHFCGEEGFRAGVPTSSSRALQHQRGWSTRLLLTVSPGDTPFSCKARPGGWPYHGQDGYASEPQSQRVGGSGVAKNPSSRLVQMATVMAHEWKP